ncbi:MAG: type II secretion system protein [Planctomycetota bacterium]|jgi:prepilin-type N-terminal cleavage/methylation domain-containing protein
MNRSHTDRCRAGFTLVELLVVISIIGLLVGILMPTIRAVLMQAYAADTQARIKSLSSGAITFKQDHQRYPGQDTYLEHGTPGGGSTIYTYSGSQVLAAHLFGLYDESKPSNPADLTDGPYERFNSDYTGAITPTSDYAVYKPDMLRTRNDRPLTIVDCFPKARPLLYYMSAVGLGVDQFHYTQNSVYTGEGDSKLEQSFKKFTVDHTVDQDLYGSGTKPAVREGQFLLISPGKDKEYFTNDDLRNWGT